MNYNNKNSSYTHMEKFPRHLVKWKEQGAEKYELYDPTDVKYKKVCIYFYKHKLPLERKTN